MPENSWLQISNCPYSNCCGRELVERCRQALSETIQIFIPNDRFPWQNIPCFGSVSDPVITGRFWQVWVYESAQINDLQIEDNVPLCSVVKMQKIHHKKIWVIRKPHCPYQDQEFDPALDTFTHEEILAGERLGDSYRKLTTVST